LKLGVSQPVITRADEDIVGIRYQATTSEDGLGRLSACESAWISESAVNTFSRICRWSINPISNPHPLSSHINRNIINTRIITEMKVALIVSKQLVAQKT
jgi:hypothetical protein